MASGGTRQDFTEDEGITPGEVRTFQFTITDSAGAPVANFTGWQFAWYVIKANYTNGLVALDALFVAADENALCKIPDASITRALPVANVPITATSLPTRGGEFWHELWRTDAGNQQRLSYGSLVVID